MERIKSFKKTGLWISIIIFMVVFQFTINGCEGDSGDSDWVSCLAVDCADTLTVRLIPNNSYLIGVYSAELIFSDDVSIKAEFEIVPATAGEENDTEYVIIQNDTYGRSWIMAYGLDYIEIGYRARIPDKVYQEDYEFTDQLLIQIIRDGESILSEYVAPEYNYYWCGGGPECYGSQNKYAEIELWID